MKERGRKGFGQRGHRNIDTRTGIYTYFYERDQGFTTYR
jgi:hypothetical protein